MYVCVCMYVCMYACMYVYVCVCARARARACVHVCMNYFRKVKIRKKCPGFESRKMVSVGNQAQ
jgi:hypothetical protein